MFVNIDNTYFIKDNINRKTLKQSISFIASQKKVRESAIKKFYKNKKLANFKLSKNIYEKNLNIIIKRKFNKDLKFVNLNDSKIFYENKNKSNSFLKKINKYKLAKIKFFPPTYQNKNVIFQKLTKGSYLRPIKLSELNKDIFKNIKKVIIILSSLNNKKMNLSKYLLKSFNKNKKDKLNSFIINSSISILKKYHKENIRLSLTHGDFKFEHLFLVNNRIDYLIDWENVGIRSVFFDLFNFFVPWFVKRNFKYFEIKNHILNFVKNYLPNLMKNIENKYDMYFYIFVIERYKRINHERYLNFDKNRAFKRFNFLFKKLIN